MASPAQIQANRLNAQSSTGPTSVEGKAATRFNALKHGADAASKIIPGENPEQLAQLTRDYYDQFQPQGPTQIALVETIIQAEWNMLRFDRIENDTWRALLAAHQDDDNPLGAAFLADARGANALQKIFRRQQAAQRQWRNGLIELRRLQQAEAAPPLPAPCPRPQPPSPAKIAPPPVAAAAPEHASKPVPGQNWVGSEPKEWRL